MSNSKNNLKNNMSLTEMMNNQEEMVENMMNAIMNNNSANNNKKNNKVNSNMVNSNKVNSNMVNSNKKNLNNTVNNKNYVEITITHPENNKKMTFKIDNKKSMEDLQKFLQKEAQVSLKKYHMLFDNGESDVESMKKVGKDTKIHLHKKKFQFKEKNRVYTLTEPLIKFRLMNGKVIEQENKYGKFDGKYPSVAARKAAASIMQSMRYEGKDIFNLPEFEFSLKEITRGSEHKISHWVGSNKLKKMKMKVYSKGKKSEPQYIEAKAIKISSRSNKKMNNSQKNNSKKNHSKINNSKVNKMKNNISKLKNNMSTMKTNMNNVSNNIGNIKNMINNM